jgi:hypothetical protein
MTGLRRRLISDYAPCTSPRSNKLGSELPYGGTGVRARVKEPGVPRLSPKNSAQKTELTGSGPGTKREPGALTDALFPIDMLSSIYWVSGVLLGVCLFSNSENFNKNI